MKIECHLTESGDRVHLPNLRRSGSCVVELSLDNCPSSVNHNGLTGNVIRSVRSKKHSDAF